MFNKNILLCIVVLQINEVLTRNCNDCKLVTTCQAAMDQAREKDNDTRKLFLKAFCGLEANDGVISPKVCCSDFPQLTQSFIEQRRTGERYLPKKCGTVKTIRLLGGLRVLDNNLPWIALIAYTTREGTQYKCGGSILNSKYILTSAHCVLGKDIAGVRVGEYDLTKNRDCDLPIQLCDRHNQDLYIDTVIPHEDYNKSTNLNDIALLRVRGEFNFSNNIIEPICLPISATQRITELDNATGVIAGWGLSDTDIKSSVLLQSNINVLRNTECSNYFETYNGELPVNRFCAGHTYNDEFVDAGGPFVMENDYNGTKRYFQYGIRTYGPVTNSRDFPTIYTDVRKYVDWILDHLSE